MAELGRRIGGSQMGKGATGWAQEWATEWGTMSSVLGIHVAETNERPTMFES